MKVYIVTYFNGEGDAGVSAVFKTKIKAQKHLRACVRAAWAVESDTGTITPAELRAKVAQALKTGFHEYPGDGSGPNPWYEIEEETVQ